METDKKMFIFMTDVEYCGKYIFRRYSGDHEYTYSKKDSKWTEDMKGQIKVKDILEKLEIEPYHVYDGGMVGGPMISYPISIKFTLKIIIIFIYSPSKVNEYRYTVYSNLRSNSIFYLPSIEGCFS